MNGKWEVGVTLCFNKYCESKTNMHMDVKRQFIMSKIKQRLFNQHVNYQYQHTITIISQLLATIK